MESGDRLCPTDHALEALKEQNEAPTKIQRSNTPVFDEMEPSAPQKYCPENKIKNISKYRQLRQTSHLTSVPESFKNEDSAPEWADAALLVHSPATPIPYTPHSTALQYDTYTTLILWTQTRTKNEKKTAG